MFLGSERLVYLAGAAEEGQAYGQTIGQPSTATTAAAGQLSSCCVLLRVSRTRAMMASVRSPASRGACWPIPSPALLICVLHAELCAAMCRSQQLKPLPLLRFLTHLYC